MNTTSGIPLDEFDLDERTFERSKYWANFLKHCETQETNEELELSELGEDENEYPDENDDNEDSDTDSAGSVDLTEEGNIVDRSNRSVVNMRSLSRTLMHQLKTSKQSVLTQLLPSIDEDNEALLNETIPQLNEQMGKWKEAGMLQVLNTFDVEKIEKKVGSWLRNNSRIDSNAYSKYKATTILPKTTKCIHDEAVEDIDDDQESMHSIDTARYVLSSRKPQQHRSCPTMTIKTFRLVPSRRDALRSKYALPAEYELAQQQLQRRHSVRHPVLLQSSSSYHAAAHAMLDLKRSSSRRKSVLRNYRTHNTCACSTDEECDQSCASAQQLQQQHLKLQMQRRKIRSAAAGASLNSFSSSNSSTQMRRRRIKANAKRVAYAEGRPMKRASECCCCGADRLCRNTLHLADTSTEDWMVENCVASPQVVLELARFKEHRKQSKPHQQQQQQICFKAPEERYKEKSKTIPLQVIQKAAAKLKTREKTKKSSKKITEQSNNKLYAIVENAQQLRARNFGKDVQIVQHSSEKKPIEEPERKQRLKKKPFVEDAKIEQHSTRNVYAEDTEKAQQKNAEETKKKEALNVQQTTMSASSEETNVKITKPKKQKTFDAKQAANKIDEQKNKKSHKTKAAKKRNDDVVQQQEQQQNQATVAEEAIVEPMTDESFMRQLALAVELSKKTYIDECKKTVVPANTKNINEIDNVNKIDNSCKINNEVLHEIADGNKENMAENVKTKKLKEKQKKTQLQAENVTKESKKKAKDSTNKSAKRLKAVQETTEHKTQKEEIVTLDLTEKDEKVIESIVKKPFPIPETLSEKKTEKEYKKAEAQHINKGDDIKRQIKEKNNTTEAVNNTSNDIVSEHVTKNQMKNVLRVAQKLAENISKTEVEKKTKIQKAKIKTSKRAKASVQINDSDAMPPPPTPLTTTTNSEESIAKTCATNMLNEIVESPQQKLTFKRSNTQTSDIITIDMEDSSPEKSLRPQPKSSKLKKLRKLHERRNKGDKSNNNQTTVTTSNETTFFTNASKICNSTATATDSARQQEMPTETMNNTTATSTTTAAVASTSTAATNFTVADDDADCSVVSSTTGGDTLYHSKLTHKGYMLYTPSDRHLAPAQSFCNGNFVVTEEHLSAIIGPKSAKKFLQFYMGRLKFNSNESVYFRPSNVQDVESESDDDYLELMSRYGSLYIEKNM